VPTLRVGTQQTRQPAHRALRREWRFAPTHSVGASKGGFIPRAHAPRGHEADKATRSQGVEKGLGYSQAFLAA